jgi:hypothetical protein
MKLRKCEFDFTFLINNKLATFCGPIRFTNFLLSLAFDFIKIEPHPESKKILKPVR